STIAGKRASITNLASGTREGPEMSIETQEPAVTPQTTGRDELALFLYFTGVFLAMGFAYMMPGLPVLLYLKERLHVSVEGVAYFWLIFSIPSYVGFVFGFIRDRWSPFRMGDRGYFCIFAPLGIAVMAWLIAIPFTYTRLLLGGFFSITLNFFLNTVIQGQLAEVGQRRLMTGRFSVLWNRVSSLQGALFAVTG